MPTDAATRDEAPGESSSAGRSAADHETVREAHAGDESVARRRFSLPRLLGQIALNLAALGGLVCIVLAAAAFLFDVTLMLFKTGSMAPTIPAGSVAVVRQVPAAELGVGDVVTVDRPGQLPVTHRITSITEADPGLDATHIITMRGDANETEDPYPYTVSEVRKVLFAVPHAANVVVLFGNPYVLGGLTIAASVLVTWAFWPRRSHEDEDDDGERQDPEPRRRHGRRAAGTAVVLLTAAGTTSVAAPTAAQAAAPQASAPVLNAPTLTTQSPVTGDFLELTTHGDETEMTAMVPGVPVYWQVGVTANAPHAGRYSAETKVLGDAEQFRISQRTCTAEWAQQGGAWHCPGTEVGATSADGLDEHGEVAPLSYCVPRHEERWYLYEVTLTDRPAGGQISTVSVRVDAFGLGSGTSATLGEAAWHTDPSVVGVRDCQDIAVPDDDPDSEPGGDEPGQTPGQEPGGTVPPGESDDDGGAAGTGDGAKPTGNLADTGFGGSGMWLGVGAVVLGLMLAVAARWRPRRRDA